MKTLLTAFAMMATAALAATVDRNEMGQCGYTGPTDFWDASGREAATVAVEEGTSASVAFVTEQDFYSEGTDLDTRPCGLFLLIR